MARQRVDASLDAFDALIADLADAGEIATSEVAALRSQRQVPQTAEIPVQARSRWVVETAAVSTDAAAAVAPQEPAAPAATAPVAPTAQPLTRREARALREAQERERAAAQRQAQPEPQTPEHAVADSPVESAVEAENVRRTEDLIHSHRVRPASFEAKPAALAAAPQRPRRSARRSLFAGIGAVALLPSLLLVVPATADALPGPATADVHGHTAQQILQIANDVQSPTIDNADYVATAIAAIVAKEGGASAEAAAPAIVDALSAGGNRAKIVETALSYIGTPYVLGGASHTGIDCSGLTMVAYAAIGINLAHYVPTQDAVGTRIPQDQAQAGDLVVFDNEDHVGVYLGDNQVLAAPAPGRRVSIESVDVWRPVGIHFTRILPNGQ
jgi:cell wall-associated NlpC family hydrolase